MSAATRPAGRSIPVLRVDPLEGARSFYVTGLGFRVDWEWRHADGLPAYVQLHRDGWSLHLTEHAEDCALGGAAYFTARDLDACLEEWRASLSQPRLRARRQPWGVRELVLRDPSGNRLTFAEEPEGGGRSGSHREEGREAP